MKKLSKTVIITLLVCMIVSINLMGQETTPSQRSDSSSKDDNIALRMALIAASRTGDFDMINLVLNKGISPDTTDKSIGLYNPRRRLARDRILSIDDIYDYPSIHCNTPLQHAAKEKRFDVMEFLLEKGANINAKDCFGRTALIHAVIRWDADVVKFLLEHGADVNIRADWEETALTYAAERGDFEIVKLLLDYGADVNAKDSGWGEESALIHAAHNGNIDLVKLLLDKGANIEAIDELDRTPLICAADEGDIDIVELLIENGANVKAKTYASVTALLYAIVEGSGSLYFEAHCGRDLLNFAPIKNKAQETYEPAKESAQYVEVVKTLLKHGSDVNITDWNGKTALMYASDRGNLAMAITLLENGANTDAIDWEGKTALIYAANEGYIEIIKPDPNFLC